MPAEVAQLPLEGNLASDGAQDQSKPRRQRDPWVNANSGNIYYRLRQSDRNSSNDQQNSNDSAAAPQPQLPTPLIRGRRSRPHAIHILTYPPGYVPRELRPDRKAEAAKRRQERDQAKAHARFFRRKTTGNTVEAKTSEPGTRTRLRDDLPVIGKLLSSLSSSATVPNLGSLPACGESNAANNSSATASMSDLPSSSSARASVCLASNSPAAPSQSRRRSALLSLPHRHSLQTQTQMPSQGCAGSGVAGGSPASSSTLCAPDWQPEGLAPSPLSSCSCPPSLPGANGHEAAQEQQQQRCRSTGTNTAATSTSACRGAATQATGGSPDPTTYDVIRPHPAPIHDHEDPNGIHHHHHHARCPGGVVSACDAAAAHHSRNHNAPGAIADINQAGDDLDRRPDDDCPNMSNADISRDPTLDMAANFPLSAYAAHHARSTYQVGGGQQRPNTLMSVRSAKSAVSSFVSEIPKPVATGSGVTCSILLAEPNVFLSGFEHDGNTQRDGQSGTAMLRGRLRLNVSKNIKLKVVQLKLLGRARTEWPEGIPPLKQDLFEEQGLRTQVLTFFNASNDGWETEYGNQCTYKLKGAGSNNSSTTNLAAPQRPGPTPGLSPPQSSRNNMSARDMKRLSLQNVQARSFGKGDSPTSAAAQSKGYKVFYPGTYDYTFDLPIDHHQLETTKLQYGSVKWELHATVERAGAFKTNLHGMKEVPIIRVPDQMSLEMSEPISISRQWEDQLHYDIIISGKSFPIGGKIPIAFKLTPLAKVQVHKLKVFITESTEYWTNDKRVTRKDPGRKVLLLEKSAGKPLDSHWASSDLRTVRGGELSSHQRHEAREMAAARRSYDAARRHVAPAPLPAPTENILGDLDLGLESFWGSTEIEANVQIPTCEMMAKNKDLRLHPDCSWKNVNVYHWIKIVMRISRLDPEDPTGTKRRHFEISIDSPFTVLNCRATQANTNLPAYAGPQSSPSPYQSVCGCPDAASILTDASPNSSSGTLPGVDMSDMPAPPQAAHLAHSATNPASGTPPIGPDSSCAVSARPMHLLRAPSYNPPAFDDDTAPPGMDPMTPVNATAPQVPWTTPPPQYDVVVGTPSVDGLADYFARLAEFGYDEPDDDSSSGDEAGVPRRRLTARSGRVNVAHPRTPGGRMTSRSLDLGRPPMQLNMDALAAARVAE